MLLLIFSLVLSIFLAYYWKDKCRAGAGWVFFISVLLSPLVGWLVAASSSIKNNGGTVKRKPNILTICGGVILLLLGAYLIIHSVMLTNPFKDMSGETGSYLIDDHNRTVAFGVSVGIGLIGFAVYASRILNTKKAIPSLSN